MNTPETSTDSITVKIRLGEIAPATCAVDQPQGHSAAELLGEAQATLVRLLTQQHRALPAWANSDEALAHEIENTLAAIQTYSATPPNRCLS